jgi:SAM-dependent methyltransferase
MAYYQEGVIVMIGSEYRDFLERTLATATRWGPYNAAVIRALELGTERYLLEPAGEFERSGATEEDQKMERKRTQDMLRPIWDKGLFGYEITHWPGGPGSTRAMELVYGNHPLPYDARVYYSEAFLLTRDLAHAVRSRKDVLRELLVREVNRHPGSQSILDLACGPCQSLREALPLLKEPSRIRFRGIDTDELAQYNNRGFFQRDHRLSWDFEVGNAITADFGKQEHDIVYSTGLYDYIHSSLLAKLWRKVYASVKPGGISVFSIKDGRAFSPLVYRWAVDWSQFYVRDENEIESIIARAELPTPESVERDATGCILVYVIRKPI